MFRSPRRRSRYSLIKSPRRFEALEQKLPLFAASGYSWSDSNVSFSFVPDGTDVEGYSNVLFAELDAVAPTAVWQREFARALQTWANASNLNFHEVPDPGVPSGTTGGGDIRLASHPLDSGVLAYAYYPVGWHPLGGDIFLSSNFNFRLGSTYDLYSVLLHEAGHSLGLDHTSGTVMNSSYMGVLSGLTTDDINGIQYLYGARQQDGFDAISANDTLAAATSLALDSSGEGSWQADLTSMGDEDFYLVQAPVAADGTLTVSVDADGISLLNPKVAVYDAGGALVGQAIGSTYGSTATANFTGLNPGANYYVLADGGTSDEFGMGAYQLNVSFGIDTVTDPPTDPPEDPPEDPPQDPPSVSPDRFEPNDSLAAAASLGRFNSRTEAGLTLHAANDSDFFSFTTRKSGTFSVSANFSDASVSSTVTIYNSAGSPIGSANDGSVSLSLSGTYYVQVASAAGDLGTYDLLIEKTGGGGGGGGSRGKGNRGGSISDAGHAYYATEEDAHQAHEDHDSHGSEDVEHPKGKDVPAAVVDTPQPTMRLSRHLGRRAARQRAFAQYVASTQAADAIEDVLDLLSRRG